MTIKRFANKRLLSLIIVFVVLVCSTVSTAFSAGISEDEYLEFVEFDETVYHCLRENGLDITKEYSISAPYEVQNNFGTDETVYFIFSEEDCIGELLVSGNNNGYVFWSQHCEAITEAYKDNIAISVSRTDPDHIYVIRENTRDVICIYGLTYVRMECNVPACMYSTVKLRPIITRNSSEGSDNRAAIDESHYITVPICANAASPNTGEGLCWLASILSMLQYNQKALGYNTLSLNNFLVSYYDPQYYSFPEGNDTWIIRTFTHFGYSLSDYGHTGLSFFSVKSIINANKPIYASLRTSSGINSHAVVICGYSRYSHTGLTIYYTYRLMDPNVTSGYVTVSVPGTGTTFTYGSYTDWWRHFY